METIPWTSIINTYFEMGLGFTIGIFIMLISGHGEGISRWLLAYDSFDPLYKRSVMIPRAIGFTVLILAGWLPLIFWSLYKNK